MKARDLIAQSSPEAAIARKTSWRSAKRYPQQIKRLWITSLKLFLPL